MADFASTGKYYAIPGWLWHFHLAKAARMPVREYGTIAHISIPN
ncbi:hypothetical protein [Thalassospira marina]|nr:hypothetical protein [Thalassospira marina]